MGCMSTGRRDSRACWRCCGGGSALAVLGWWRAGKTTGQPRLLGWCWWGLVLLGWLVVLVGVARCSPWGGGGRGTTGQRLLAVLGGWGVVRLGGGVWVWKAGAAVLGWWGGEDDGTAAPVGVVLVGLVLLGWLVVLVVAVVLRAPQSLGCAAVPGV